MHSQVPMSQLSRAWGLAVGPTRGPRPKLQADDIAAQAVKIADTDGIDAVTLARVADQCGVVTTALYRYVESKADLIDLMSEHALHDPPRIKPGSRGAVDRWIAAFSDRLARHPWLAAIQPRGVPLGPNSLGWLDLLVRILDSKGIEDIAGVALQLSTTVRAYVAMQSSVTEPPPDWWGPVVAERYPALAAAFADRDLTTPEDDLAAAVRRILDAAT